MTPLKITLSYYYLLIRNRMLTHHQGLLIYNHVLCIFMFLILKKPLLPLKFEIETNLARLFIVKLLKFVSVTMSKFIVRSPCDVSFDIDYINHGDGFKCFGIEAQQRSSLRR